MTAVKRATPAHISLAQQMGVAIVTGDYEPGAAMPSELELAERLGVSRSVIREALRILSSKGLIDTRPKAGTRVRARAEWNHLDPELLGWMFEGGAPPLSFIRSLFQLRLIVEPSAAELAAVGRSAQQLSRMGHALEEMAHYGLAREEGRVADHRFHALILEATDNELLVSLSASISAAVHWTTYFKYRGNVRPNDPLPEHRVLFEAIADGNAAAAREATAVLVRQALADTERSIEDYEQKVAAKAARTAID